MAYISTGAGHTISLKLGPDFVLLAQVYRCLKIHHLNLPHPTLLHLNNELKYFFLQSCWSAH